MTDATGLALIPSSGAPQKAKIAVVGAFPDHELKANSPKVYSPAVLPHLVIAPQAHAPENPVDFLGEDNVSGYFCKQFNFQCVGHSSLKEHVKSKQHVVDNPTKVREKIAHALKEPQIYTPCQKCNVVFDEHILNKHIIKIHSDETFLFKMQLRI